MEKSEAIAILKSLIANIENDHISLEEVMSVEGGSLHEITLMLSGDPKIGRVEPDFFRGVSNGLVSRI